jgi:hypothetical protein
MSSVELVRCPRHALEVEKNGRRRCTPRDEQLRLPECDPLLKLERLLDVDRLFLAFDHYVPCGMSREDRRKCVGKDCKTPEYLALRAFN